VRDYVEWHKAYEDPASALSWRLRTVQGYIADALDARTGPVRILSLCAGEGRDVIDLLTQRSDAARVHATLVEVHPGIAGSARARAESAGLSGIEVRTADAGLTNSLEGAVPADIVLLVGIFGNISDDDIEQTIAVSPQFCNAGATVVWSRGREASDRNDAIRAWFAAHGFAEIDYATLDAAYRPALGAFRFEGQAQPLVPDRKFFTFLR
jgi:hypothetical protein